MSDEVTSARPREGGAKVAVKRTNLCGISAGKLADCRREAELHLSLDHPHIATLHRVYETDQEQSLVMELLEGGDAFDVISSQGALSENQAASYLRQVLLALEYLHEQGIAHGDIKPENFVFADEQRNTLKLIDFGFSRRWDGQPPLGAFKGTPMYAAPEVFRGEYDSKADLWSLGVVAYVFLCEVPPWVADEEASLAMIKAGEPRYSPKRFESALSAEAKDFVRALLNKDDAERLDATAALAHSWIQARAGEAVEVPVN